VTPARRRLLPPVTCSACWTAATAGTKSGSAEVARLELGDIDWRAGQITLRGKASRQDGMPLPCDVGEALAAYLSQARPATPLRQVFLAAKAPMRAIPPGLVSDVTHRACDRAGRPRIGAHRLRHTLATPVGQVVSGWGGRRSPAADPVDLSGSS